MKLTEKQSFIVLNKILKWLDLDITEEIKSDFVMQELINLELK